MFGVGNVLATMFRIWFRQLHRILALALLCYLPYIAWFVMAQTEWGMDFLNEHYYMPLMGTSPMLASLASGEWVCNAVLAIAIAHLTFAAMLRERPSIGAAMKLALRRSVVAIAVNLFVRLLTLGVMTFVAILMFGSRGWFMRSEFAIWSWVACLLLLQSLFVPALPIVAAERRGVFRPLWRALTLSHRNRIKVFAILIVQTALMWIVFRVAFELLQPSFNDDFEHYERVMRIWGAVSVAFDVLLASLFDVMAAVVYERLREAKEGMRPAELDKVFD